MQYPVFCDETTITGDGTEEHVLTVIGGGGGSPGGSLGDIQFNNPLGTFDGSDDFQFFPEGSAGGEFFIFSSSDGNNCELFIGTDLSTSRTTGTFIAQVDHGNILITMNDQTDAPLGIAIENNHANGAGIAILDTSGGGIEVQAGDGVAVLSPLNLQSAGFSPTDRGTVNLGGVSGGPADIFIGESGGALDTIRLTGTTLTAAMSGNTTIGGSNVALEATGNIFIQTSAGGASINLNGGGTICEIKIGSVITDEVGFFGVGPVSQQPTPVLLSDVIALLQAYGLAA